MRRRLVNANHVRLRAGCRRLRRVIRLGVQSAAGGTSWSPTEILSRWESNDYATRTSRRLRREANKVPFARTRVPLLSERRSRTSTTAGTWHSAYRLTAPVPDRLN